jgi:hypothetical protein
MRRLGTPGLFLTLIALLGSSLIVSSQAAAQEITVSVPEIRTSSESLQEVFTQLFGSSETAGLLSRDEPFEFKAENLVISSEQAQEFLSSAGGNISFGSLASAIRDLPGTELKFAGLIDGSPFEAKFEPGEIKLEGMQLSQDQLNALVDQLKAIPGVREAKAEVVVDGKTVEVKVENGITRVRTEDRAGDDRRHRNRGRENSGGDDSLERHGRHHRGDRPEDNDRVERHDRSGRRDRTERVERVEKSERPERTERSERAERVERLDNSGPGSR